MSTYQYPSALEAHSNPSGSNIMYWDVQDIVSGDLTNTYGEMMRMFLLGYATSPWNNDYTLTNNIFLGVYGNHRRHEATLPRSLMLPSLAV